MGSFDRVVLEESVELGNKLGVVAEGDEAAIQCPRWAGYGLVSRQVDVVLSATKNDALADGLLTRVGLGVKVLHGRLRDVVQEAKAGKRVHQSLLHKSDISKADSLLVTLLCTRTDDTLENDDFMKSLVEGTNVEDPINSGLCGRDSELGVARDDDHAVNLGLESRDPVGVELLSDRLAGVTKVHGISQLALVERAVPNVFGDSQLHRPLMTPPRHINKETRCIP